MCYTTLWCDGETSSKEKEPISTEPELEGSLQRKFNQIMPTGRENSQVDSSATIDPVLYLPYRWKILRSTNPGTPKTGNCFELPSDWLLSYCESQWEGSSKQLLYIELGFGIPGFLLLKLCLSWRQRAMKQRMRFGPVRAGSGRMSSTLCNYFE